MKFNVILFDDFETIDAFGPVEVIGKLPKEYSLAYHSLQGGIIKSSQHTPVDTLSFVEADTSGVLLIPGGMGTRSLINDVDFNKQLKVLAEKASYVLTVCTGSALLSKTDLLNGLKATSNKMAFEWACSVNSNVNWVKRAKNG